VAILTAQPLPPPRALSSPSFASFSASAQTTGGTLNDQPNSTQCNALLFLVAQCSAVQHLLRALLSLIVFFLFRCEGRIWWKKEMQFDVAEQTRDMSSRHVAEEMDGKGKERTEELKNWTELYWTANIGK